MAAALADPDRRCGLVMSGVRDDLCARQPGAACACLVVACNWGRVVACDGRPIGSGADPQCRAAARVGRVKRGRVAMVI